MFTAKYVILSNRQHQYSDETATTLAKQLLEGVTDESCIAVVSAPSVFIQIKNLLVCPRSKLFTGEANINTDVGSIFLQAEACTARI